MQQNTTSTENAYVYFVVASVWHSLTPCDPAPLYKIGLLIYVHANPFFFVLYIQLFIGCSL
jgi:hypothetical protein